MDFLRHAEKMEEQLNKINEQNLNSYRFGHQLQLQGRSTIAAKQSARHEKHSKTAAWVSAFIALLAFSVSLSGITYKDIQGWFSATDPQASSEKQP